MTENKTYDELEKERLAEDLIVHPLPGTEPVTSPVKFRHALGRKGRGTMKCASVIAVTFMTIAMAALGIEAEKMEMSATDLASHLGIRHSTFTFHHGGAVTSVSSSIAIYRGGEVVYRGVVYTNATLDATKKEMRYSIIHEDKGDSFKITVIENGQSRWMSIPKPEGLGSFNIDPKSVKFDEKGRLVLAFQVEPEDGHIRITETNSTVESAAAALVFEIEIQ